MGDQDSHPDQNKDDAAEKFHATAQFFTQGFSSENADDRKRGGDDPDHGTRIPDIDLNHGKA